MHLGGAVKRPVMRREKSRQARLPAQVDFFEKGARTAILAGLLLAPLIFYRGALDAFGLPKAVVLWVCGCVALGCVLLGVAVGHLALPRLRLAWPAIALLAAYGLATGFSIAPWVSLRGIHDRYNGLIAFALCEGIALTVAWVYARRPLQLREMAIVLALSSVLAAGYVILQFLRLDPLKWGPGASASFLAKANARHPPGTLGNSNYVGGTLAVMLPFVAWSAMSAVTRRGRTLWLAGTMLQALAVWLSRSRGGLFGAIVALGVLAYVNRAWLRTFTGGSIGLRPIAVGVLALVLVLAPVVSRARLAEVGDSLTAVRRWQYWRGAAAVFRAHPIVGTGPDTFYASYGPHRPAVDGAAHGLISPPDKPHNVYLEYAASTGVLGLAAFLALVGLTLTYGARTLRRLDGPSKALLSVFLASLVGYLAQAMVSFDAFPLPLLAWASIGAIAAFADPGVNRDAAALFARRESRIAAGLVGVTLLVSIPLVAGPLRADRAANLGQDRENVGDLTAAARRFSRAMALDGSEATYAFRRGIVEEKLAERSESVGRSGEHLGAALAFYRRALQHAPGHPFIEQAVGRASTTLAQKVDPRRFPAADRAWRTFISHDPTDWEPRLLRVEMLISWADAGGGGLRRAQARAELSCVRRMPHLEARGSEKIARLYARLGDPYWIEVVREMALPVRAAPKRTSVEQNGSARRFQRIQSRARERAPAGSCRT